MVYAVYQQFTGYTRDPPEQGYDAQEFWNDFQARWQFLTLPFARPPAFGNARYAMFHRAQRGRNNRTKWRTSLLISPSGALPQIAQCLRACQAYRTWAMPEPVAVFVNEEMLCKYAESSGQLRTPYRVLELVADQAVAHGFQL